MRIVSFSASALAAWAAVPALVVLLGSPAVALVPWPDLTRCSVVVVPPQDGCQHVFLPGPASERLTLDVTLRDAFDNPLPEWTVKATALPEAESVVCACESLSAEQVSGVAGDARVRFGLLGGRGTLRLEIRATHPLAGTYPIDWISGLAFTSADQGASCAPTGPAANVVDLGLWARGLPPAPYRRASDLNCDGTVNVVDLGRFGSGLYEGCAEDLPGQGLRPAIGLPRTRSPEPQIRPALDTGQLARLSCQVPTPTRDPGVRKSLKGKKL